MYHRTVAISNEITEIVKRNHRFMLCVVFTHTYGENNYKRVKQFSIFLFRISLFSGWACLKQ